MMKLSSCSETAKSARDWFEKGCELKEAGDFAGALNAFKQSARLDPSVASPFIAMAQILNQNSQFDEARTCLQFAVNTEPQHLFARKMLAAFHQKLGEVDDALREYQRALAQCHDDPSLHYGLGQVYEDKGDALEAAKCYQKAMSFNEHIPALSGLIGLHKQVDVSVAMQIAQARLTHLNANHKALLGYSLGQALEYKGRYDEAFVVYKIANAARQSVAGAFNRDSFDARITEYQQVFTRQFFQARASWGDAHYQPVFIVGLPRSGTTLTEQILAAHPDCFGAGELDCLTDLTTGAPDLLDVNDVSWPLCASRLTQQHIATMAAAYKRHMKQRNTRKCAFVVDKQPLNFWHIGAIALMFPRAKIINCERDIRDCGLSIYTQNFSETQNWSTCLDDIVYYWRGYRKLMSQWQNVTSLSIMSVKYEQTIADIYSQSQKLLAFTGMSWNKSVLDFHKVDRPVQTPSRWQVRQPVYTTSTGRWRYFAQRLSPLQRAYASCIEQKKGAS